MENKHKHYEDHYIDIDGVKTRYWETGSGDETLLLIHGFNGSIEEWVANIPSWETDYRIIALDMIGCGMSQKPKVDYSYPIFAEFLHSFCRAKKIVKPHIVGHSMGGSIAIQYAALYPDDIKSLILVAPSFFCRKFPIFFQLISVPLLGEILFRPPSSHDALIAGLRTFTYKPIEFSDQTIKASFEMQHVKGYAKPLLHFNRKYTTLFGLKRICQNYVESTKMALSNAIFPVLLLWGKQDTIVHYSAAADTLAALPISKLISYDECGHCPNFEYPEDFNKKVLEFISLQDNLEDY